MQFINLNFAPKTCLSIGIQIADYSDYNLFRIICDESSSGVCKGSSLSFFFFQLAEHCHRQEG